MATEDEDKWFTRISQYIDQPCMFYTRGAEMAFMTCMEKFLYSEYLGDVTDFQFGEKSLSLKLGKRHAKFWIQWIEISQKFCCGYSFGEEQCFMFWESDEPQKYVRDRIKNMYRLFIHKLDVAEDTAYLMSKYDVEFCKK